MALEALRSEPAVPGNWRSSLNDAQRAAVTHSGGPLLIVAGAGTGKTMTLASRVAHLIESGTPPQRILLLTFSRRAAREMLNRVQSLVEPGATSRVWSGTFHSVATRLLRIFGRAVGLEPVFTVIDQADAADLLNLIRSDSGADGKKNRFARKETLAAIYSRTVNSGDPLADVLETHFPWCRNDAAAIGEIFREYTTRKRNANLLDYDDLLLYWNALAHSPAAEKMAAQFDHVLVDEYQDTNALQAQILQAFHRDIPDITVVGDDAQAIYSFRSATVANILNFAQEFSGATVVKLEENYRSTPALLDASNAVIAESPQRHEKTLWSQRKDAARPQLITCRDELAQAAAVCDSLLEHRERGIPLMQQAVLFRTSHHSDVLEVELSRRNIPFVKYGGLKFLEAAHVKDVVALLRIIENPHDEISWYRVLLLLEGIGPAHAKRLLQSLTTGPSGSVPTPLNRLIADPPPVPDIARESLVQLQDALSACLGDGGRSEPPLASQLERLRLFCEPVFARKYGNADVRLADIDQLAALAETARSRTAFLTEMVLDPPNSTSDLAGPPHLDEDFAVLSTIHSAKGGEWDVVMVLHAADGMIPSDMATRDTESIEEERRLFYVAVTRARDTLEVYFPQRYYSRPRGLNDRHGYAQVTRFLTEPIRRRFDEVVLAGESYEDPSTVEVVGTASVDGYLAKLW